MSSAATLNGPATVAARRARQQAELLGPGVVKKTNDTVVLKKSEIERLKTIVGDGSGEGATSPALGASMLAPPGAASALSQSGRSLAGRSHTSASTSAAAERKQRIMENARKTQSTGTTDVERERADQNAALARRARELLDEEEDEVKAMNAMMLYSQCVTIRDAQLQEKKMIEDERRKEELRADMVMEMERLKALQMYEEREVKRIEDRKQGAMIIRKQISERERERMLEQERRELEQQAMMKHIEKMRQQDQQEAEQRKFAAQRLMEEVEAANLEQIRLKQREREMEVEEDRRITAYMREKEAREKALAEEKLRIAQEKEREVARLRALQEKALDKAAELDALRAKRAQEASERAWRAKEKAEAEKAASRMRDMHEAREMQQAEKERRLAQLARHERDEFQRIVLLQQEQERMQREAEEANAERRRQFATQLRDQIDESEEARRRERLAFMEEGVLQAKEREKRQQRIEEIRRKKLAEMSDMGVPDKYRVELAMKSLKPK